MSCTDIWTHWDLNPGPSACEADVIPLHHVPLVNLQKHRRHISKVWETIAAKANPVKTMQVFAKSFQSRFPVSCQLLRRFTLWWPNPGGDPMGPPRKMCGKTIGFSNTHIPPCASHPMLSKKLLAANPGGTLWDHHEKCVEKP